MDIKCLIGETTEYDKKQALEIKKPKSWCKSVSAYANGTGGCLIFGISDEDEIIGLEKPEEIAEIISEQIKTRLDPIPEFNLKFHRTETNKTLVILEVFAGNQTPYYYRADGSLMAYQRIGNESVPVTNLKLKELVLRGSSFTYDSLISRYKFEKYSFNKLRETYKKQTGNDFIDSDFESFNIVNEEGFLTNAGALIADDSPIRHSRIFCTRWNGKDKASGIIDALDDEEYEGGLIELLLNSMNFVKRNTKKAWMKMPDGRMELPDYPERAVLEGIVNGIVHRSYMDLGSEVHIDIFDDRLEIFSPGGMINGKNIQDLNIMNISSRRRNPIIADIFSRLKYMDRRGSGLKKIVEEYSKQPYYQEDIKPTFYSDESSFNLTMKNMNYKKDLMTHVADARILKKEKYITDNIINLMISNPEITRKELAQELGISVNGVRYHVKKLNANGVISYVGSSKKGYWKIIKKNQ